MLDLTASQVENALFDIRRKQQTTEYLRMAPLSPMSATVRATAHSALPVR